MRIVPNTGTDRVIDILRPWLVGGNRVDLASGTLSIFAFRELADGLARLAAARLVVEMDVESEFLGGPADRAARNRLDGRWLAGRCADWIEKSVDVRNATRRSIHRVLVESQRLRDFQRNPRQFIAHAARATNECKQEALVDGIRHQRTGDGSYYAQESNRRN